MDNPFSAGGKVSFSGYLKFQLAGRLKSHIFHIKKLKPIAAVYLK